MARKSEYWATIVSPHGLDFPTWFEGLKSRHVQANLLSIIAGAKGNPGPVPPELASEGMGVTQSHSLSHYPDSGGLIWRRHGRAKVIYAGFASNVQGSWSDAVARSVGMAKFHEKDFVAPIAPVLAQYDLRIKRKLRVGPSAYLPGMSAPDRSQVKQVGLELLSWGPLRQKAMTPPKGLEAAAQHIVSWLDQQMIVERNPPKSFARKNALKAANEMLPELDFDLSDQLDEELQVWRADARELTSKSTAAGLVMDAGFAVTGLPWLEVMGIMAATGWFGWNAGRGVAQEFSSWRWSRSTRSLVVHDINERVIQGRQRVADVEKVATASEQRFNDAQDVQRVAEAEIIDSVRDRIAAIQERDFQGIDIDKSDSVRKAIVAAVGYRILSGISFEEDSSSLLGPSPTSSELIEYWRRLDEQVRQAGLFADLGSYRDTMRQSVLDLDAGTRSLEPRRATDN